MTSRIIVWCVIVALILYDIPTAYYGRITISEAVRQVDLEVNGLLRWTMLGLWLHWFVKTWYTG
jgi:hypothetical protein